MFIGLDLKEEEMGSIMWFWVWIWTMRFSKKLWSQLVLVTDSSWDMIISDVGGSVSIFHYDQYREKCCYIWVMVEYGVAESWTKQFRVALDVSSELKLVKVMGLKNNGHLLVEMYCFGWKKGELASHDYETKENEFHGVLTDPGYSTVLLYMESLLLLNE